MSFGGSQTRPTYTQKSLPLNEREVVHSIALLSFLASFPKWGV